MRHPLFDRWPRRALRALSIGLLALSAAAAASGQCLVPSDLIINGGPGKDGIPSLTNPKTLTASLADSTLLPEDMVLGVVVNGEARAYPHAILWWHEIINDVLGGRPILVTFCPLTGSGIVYDPVFDGTARNFGVSGLLYDNNLIMFDRTTDSLWSQMRLDSICGSMMGTRPPLIPVVQSTWAAWKALHPETTVVSFDTGFSRNYDVYPYGDYDRTDNGQLLFPQTVVDPRLPPKENVLGIGHEGVSRAYSLTRMATAGPRLAINDTVNGLPILVVSHAASQLALSFDRRLPPPPETPDAARQKLGFDIATDTAGAAFPFRLRDRQTGSLWNLNGVAVDGPLKGARLRKIPAFTSFWFAWSAFNPGTQIHALGAAPAASGS